MLNRNRYRLPTSVKISIYHSLFASHINYTHLVWGTTTESNLRKIHLLQKKIIRIIANVPYHNHTEHLFKHYNIPTIYSLYNRSLLRIWHANLSSENSVFNEIACLQKIQLPILPVMENIGLYPLQEPSMAGKWRKINYPDCLIHFMTPALTSLT